MLAKECKNIGIECGLATWEEAFDNIYVHAPNLFPYENINKELEELHHDIKSNNYKMSDNLREHKDD